MKKPKYLDLQFEKKTTTWPEQAQIWWGKFWVKGAHLYYPKITSTLDPTRSALHIPLLLHTPCRVLCTVDQLMMNFQWTEPSGVTEYYSVDKKQVKFYCQIHWVRWLWFSTKSSDGCLCPTHAISRLYVLVF